MQILINKSKYDISEPGEIIYWTGRGECTENTTYILTYIDENAHAIRALTLKLLFDFSHCPNCEVSIYEKLRLLGAFSFLDMTLVAEQAILSKAPEFEDFVKIVALKHLLSDKKITNLNFVGGRPKIKSLIYQSLNYDYTDIFYYKLLKYLHTINTVFLNLYYIIKSLVFFILRIFQSFKVDAGIVKNIEADILFVNYLFAVKNEEIASSTFPKAYWGDLPVELTKLSHNTLWLHIWVPSESLPKKRDAQKYIEKLNLANPTQSHILVNDRILFADLLIVFTKWILVLVKILNIVLNIRRYVKIEMSYMNLIRDLLLKSATTPSALGNLIFYQTINRILQSQKKIKKCVYLFENQPWEAALCYLWRTRFDGEIIGFAHATIRFWDLRYHFDNRLWSGALRNLPDKVAVHGPMSVNALTAGGLEVSRIVEVEALRYSKPRIRTRVQSRKKSDLRVLILGDGLKSYTQFQVGLVDEALAMYDRSIKVEVKSHPNYLIQSDDFKNIEVSFAESNLYEALSKVNIVIASDTTGAALEAWAAGKVVICTLRPEGLNYSPLLGLDGVLFASTASQLNKILTELTEHTSFDTSDRMNCFNFASDLYRWKDLLLSAKEKQ